MPVMVRVMVQVMVRVMVRVLVSGLALVVVWISALMLICVFRPQLWVRRPAQV